MDPLHLAIDSSCAQPVVAVLRGFESLESWEGEPGPHHGELVLHGVDHCLERAGVAPEDLAFLSTGIGPGTFTGLRIGITTAKFLASTWKKQIVPVSSLYAQAQIVLDEPAESTAGTKIWSLIDARRNEVYAANYSVEELQSRQDKFSDREFACPPEEFVNKLSEGDLLVGDGATNFQEHWPSIVQVLDKNQVPLNAANLGAVAYQSFLDKRFLSATEIAPKYFRTEKF